MSALETVERDQPILRIENLFTAFPTNNGGEVKAVDDATLNLYPGRTLCLVGESGSGKSVLSRSILQIVDPPGEVRSGKMLLRLDEGGGQVDIVKLHPRSRQIRSIRGASISMIFQEPMSSLSPIHRIGDQIGEVLRLHKRMSKAEARERSIELLGQVEIRDPATAVDRYPFEYSGGMRQRAMIAMALASDPRLLIADEPTTALDVSVQANILDLLRRLQAERGMSILFITHDMGVVAEIADDVAVMRFGKIVEQGDVDTIFHNPQHAYTRMLLASISAESIKREQADGAAPARPIIEVTDVIKRFGSFRALDSVSFELIGGETLGVVGESGSGKTTLARCLQRVYEPDGGVMTYTDRNGAKVDLASQSHRQLVSGAWRDIRTVFQDPFASLNPRMTVEQIIGEPLLVQKLLGGQALKKRVAELLELVGLPAGAAQRYPHAFSGGQRQRISIARALAPNPRIVIADEATSALDVTIRNQILTLLEDLKQQLGLSYVFISHDMSLVRRFCDRVLVMKDGQIVEQGAVLNVFDSPQHAYTRRLLAAVPISDPRNRADRIRHSNP